MVKNGISAVVSNPKLSMASSKISPDAIEGFSMLTINNDMLKVPLFYNFCSELQPVA